jgi:hypothetical protein
MPDKPNHPLARIGDFVAYIAIGVGIVIAIVWFATRDGNSGDIESVGKRIGL